MKILDSNKFITVIIVLNIVVITVLVVGVFQLKNKEMAADSVPIELGANRVEGYDFTYADDSLVNIYTTLIENTSAELEGGIYFKFGEGGNFAGFFDSNNPKVKGYKYKISTDKKDILLTIYDKEETQTVTYTLVILNDGSMALDYPGLKSRIVLSY